jgi:hypothetical protein
MSSMKFNARLDTPHHGPPNLCKDAGVFADSLTDIHNAMVKCSSLSTGAGYTRVFRCPHRYKSTGLKSGGRGGHAAGPPLPIPLS